MRPLPNLAVAIGALLLVSGVLTWLGTNNQDRLPLPTIPQTNVAQPASGPGEGLSRDWSAPWTTPAVSRPVPKKVEPAPVVEVRPVPKPDTTTLRLVGSMTGNLDKKTFLFKNTQLGTVITLSEGSESKGWLLTQVEEHKLTIVGPGGVYEVSR